MTLSFVPPPPLGVRARRVLPNIQPSISSLPRVQPPPLDDPRYVMVSQVMQQQQQNLLQKLEAKDIKIKQLQGRVQDLERNVYLLGQQLLGQQVGPPVVSGQPVPNAMPVGNVMNKPKKNGGAQTNITYPFHNARTNANKNAKSKTNNTEKKNNRNKGRTKSKRAPSAPISFFRKKRYYNA